jgi:hypothetical protein
VHLTEALSVGSKEVGLKGNADKTKYMAIPRDKDAGRSHDMKFDNSSFERVEEFKCLEKILTNENSIQEEIKSRLRSGNANLDSRMLDGILIVLCKSDVLL